MARRSTLGACVAVASCAAATAVARTRRVPVPEERVFRSVNGLPDVLHGAIWPVMQMGSLGAVLVAAGDLHRRGGDRRRTALVAGAGVAVWGGIKLVKPLVGRGRPADLLEGVRVRGAAQSGLGFPSGHAAVAMTLALTATSSTRARRVAVAAAAVTGISRIYVAAHLPLDVVAGTAAGWLVGQTLGGRRGVSATT